jgi:serine/threonine protein kinase
MPYGGWEKIEPPLGRGGQSTVYLARSPERVSDRSKSTQIIKAFSGGTSIRSQGEAENFAKAMWSLARMDIPEEVGALKIFRAREGGAPAEARLKREIAVLREDRVGLPRLYAADESEQWMITEYFPEGSLERNPELFKGRAVAALRAFRTLARTIAAALHKDGIVHRDIKPANIFVRADGTLVPGDFGIVYLPHVDRHTFLNERVGPRDYMPPWTDLGSRVEDVAPNADVYMLGKLLWCMISGRAKLPREYFRRPEFDLEEMFPGDPQMRRINSIVARCVVETPDACLPSADDLLGLVDQTLKDIDRDVPELDRTGKPILLCRVCGQGTYQEWSPNVGLTGITDAANHPMGAIRLRILLCNVCGHYGFFPPGNPDEAASRGWRPRS